LAMLCPKINKIFALMVSCSGLQYIYSIFDLAASKYMAKV